MRRQTAEPGTSADDDGVVVGEILDFRDRGGLIELVVGLAGDLLGDELGHPLDVDLRTGLTRPLGDCVRHRLDMAVGRIVENQNLWHFLFLTVNVRSAKSTPLRGIDQNQLRIFDCRDLDEGGICDGRAIACLNSCAVHFDRAGGRNQIAVAFHAQRIVDRLAGLQRRTQHPRVGADRQRVLVLFEAAGQRDKAPRAVAPGERLRAPRRRTATLRRYDPDLEDPGRPRLEIVFGVPDAGPRTHHLHIACLGTALVAEVVLVRDGALADVGDDFHVGVRMGWKAGVGGDLIVVPHAQSAPAHSGWVREFAERKVVPGPEPAMVRGGELVECLRSIIVILPGMTSFRPQRYGQTKELKIEIMEINRFRI